MRYFLLFTILLAAHSGFCQEQHNWVFKVRPNSFLLDSYLAIGLEKSLSSSFTTDLNIKWKRKQAMQSQSDVFPFHFQDGQGVQLDLLWKWFPGKKAPKGFYLAVLQRYLHFSTAAFTYFESVPPVEDDLSYDIVHKRNQIGVMLLTGYQFVFHSGFSLEFNGGFGIMHRRVKEKLVDEEVQAHQLEDRVWEYTEKVPAIYLGCTLGYAF